MLSGWNSYGRYLIRILGSIEFFLIQVFNLSPIKIYNFKYDPNFIKLLFLLIQIFYDL
jgi:hypothetical protein